VQVLFEPRHRQFPRDYSSPEPGVSLQYEDFLARLRQDTTAATKEL